MRDHSPYGPGIEGILIGFDCKSALERGRSKAFIEAIDHAQMLAPENQIKQLLDISKLMRELEHDNRDTLKHLTDAFGKIPDATLKLNPEKRVE